MLALEIFPREKLRMNILPSILYMDGGGRTAWGKDWEYRNKTAFASSIPVITGRCVPDTVAFWF